MPLLSPTPANITHAAKVLADGGLVVFPTETVLGLGAAANMPTAVADIFTYKQRPAHNPLIVHCASLAQAKTFGIFNDAALQLAHAFWPGPLSLVVPRRPQAPIAKAVYAGLPSIALRVPAHPVAQALLRRFGGPIAAPSANPSGYLSPTRVHHITPDWRNAVVILRETPTQRRARRGLESTILSCLEATPQLLRAGALAQAQLAQCLGSPVQPAAPEPRGQAKRSPGRLLRHYAPRARLRLQADAVRPHEALLAFGRPLPHQGIMRNLSARGSLSEAAANLFAALHWLDARANHIAVQPIPDTGLGAVINERLTRAAQAPHGS